MTVTVTIPFAINLYYILATIWGCVSVWVSFCAIQDFGYIRINGMRLDDLLLSIGVLSLGWGTTYALYLAGGHP